MLCMIQNLFGLMYVACGKKLIGLMYLACDTKFIWFNSWYV